MRISAGWTASYDFACHSEACSPPNRKGTGGTGGSLPGERDGSINTRALNSKSLRGLSVPDNGFTLSDKLVPMRSGFAVALAGTDKLVVAASSFKNGEPSEKLISLVMDRIDAALLTKPPKGTKIALGGWHNPKDGKIEINVTVVFPKNKEAEAFAFAQAQDQISMFALHRGNVIDTGGTGGKRKVTR